VELDDPLAINGTQLGTLIFKCKSSINGSFRLMGYSTPLNAISALNKLSLEQCFSKIRVKIA
jgi:hypothetical protein